MRKSFFRPAERQLLLTHFDDWRGLAGSGTQRDQDGNIYNAKDNLIDDIIQELFERFPERDLAQCPTSLDVMSQDDRDRLHTASYMHHAIDTHTYSSFRSLFVEGQGTNVQREQKGSQRQKYTSQAYETDA